MRTNFDAHKTKIPEDHKRALRAQLLLHADEKLTKPAKLPLLKFWPAVVIPIAALALFMVVPMLHQPAPKAPSNIHDTAVSLTPQKVFALASAQLDGQLKAGQYFYTKTIEESVFNDKDASNEGLNNCLYDKSYRETYRNQYGVQVRTTRLDKNGILYQLNTEVDDNHIGMKPGAEFYYNTSVAKADQSPVACPAMMGGSGGAPVSQMTIEEYMRSDRYRAEQGLQSGDYARQKEAFGLLAKEKDFKMTQHQLLSDYPNQVIILTAGDGPTKTTYYFDQTTKAYVGMDSGGGRSHVIVVEQGIRALPTNDPPEYFQVTPMGR